MWLYNHNIIHTFCICMRRIRQCINIRTCIMGWSLRLLYKTPSLGPHCWDFSMFRLRAFAAWRHSVNHEAKLTVDPCGTWGDAIARWSLVYSALEWLEYASCTTRQNEPAYIHLHQMQAAEADWIEIRRVKTCQTIEFFLASLGMQSKHKT